MRAKILSIASGAILAVWIAQAVSAIAFPTEATLTSELAACRTLADARARGWTHLDYRFPVATSRCRDLSIHWDGLLSR